MAEDRVIVYGNDGSIVLVCSMESVASILVEKFTQGQVRQTRKDFNVSDDFVRSIFLQGYKDSLEWFEMAILRKGSYVSAEELNKLIAAAEDILGILERNEYKDD